MKFIECLAIIRHPVEENECYTLLKGLKELAGDRQLKTCSYTALTTEKKKEVEALTEWADVVVLALGGSSSRFEGALFDDNGAAIVHHEKRKEEQTDETTHFLYSEKQRSLGYGLWGRNGQ